VILNKQFFKKKNEKIDLEPYSSDKKLYNSEKLTPKTSQNPQNLQNQKTPERSKLLTNTTTNITRALSPNSILSSSGKLKTQTSGTPQKKIRTSPIILDTIVNQVVDKYAEDKKNVFEDDMDKINDCLYLTNVCNEDEEKKAECLINHSFGENNDQ